MILKKRVLSLYEKPPESGIVLCLDEKGPMAAKEYGGRKWCGNVPELDVRQKTHGVVNCFGAYNVHKDEIFIKCYDRKTSRDFIDFIAKVRKRWHHVKIKAVLDNVSSHKSNMTTNAMKRYKRIEPVFLPTSSPKLNRIEGKWDLLQEEVINNQKFESREELVATIEGWAEYYNGERKKIYSKKKVHA